MNHAFSTFTISVLLGLAAAFAPLSAVAAATSAHPPMLDASAIDAWVLRNGPDLVEARLRLRLEHLTIELDRRPEAPMLEWRLVPGGLDLESMLLQPISAMLTRELRTRKADAAREQALAEYSLMVLRMLVAGRRAWHATIVAERRLALAAERADLAEKQWSWHQARQLRGEDGAMTLLELQAALSEATAEVKSAEAGLVRRRAALARILGMESIELPSLPTTLPIALAPWAGDAAQDVVAIPSSGPLPIHLARIELKAAEVESLLRHHAGANWMPALGLESGAMETALRIGFSPTAWGRGRLERERANTARLLSTRRLDYAQRQQSIALMAAVRILDTQRRAEADHVRIAETGLQQLALATAQQSSGESGPEAVWKARAAWIDADLATWRAREATLSAALGVTLALGGEIADATAPSPGGVNTALNHDLD